MDEYTRVTNENWRGKNDPAERRRIQNRINQRAFRQRQREGDPSKKSQSPDARKGVVVPNAGTIGWASGDESGDGDTKEGAWTSDGHTPGGRQFDELARLINRNFYAAASSNARYLNIKTSSLQDGEIGLSARPSKTVADTLVPTSAQHQVPHDLLIDTLPHVRLRYNILRAMATSSIDAHLLCHELRCSGALECIEGTWQRIGLIVWGNPDQISSWEISAGFLRRWGHLLHGCEDLLAIANSWRAQRGESMFPTSLGCI